MSSPSRRRSASSPARLLGPIALPLALVVGAAACGSGEEVPGLTEAGVPVDDSAGSALPEVTVLDLASGEDVRLASYVPADRPVLVWMWAPF